MDDPRERMKIVRSVRLRPDQYKRHWEDYGISLRSGHIRDMLDEADEADRLRYEILYLERELGGPRECREVLTKFMWMLRKEKGRGGTHFDIVELILVFKDLIEALEAGNRPCHVDYIADCGAVSSQGHQIIVKCADFVPLEGVEHGRD